jgi:hypothetical protein
MLGLTISIWYSKNSQINFKPILVFNPNKNLGTEKKSVSRFPYMRKKLGRRFTSGQWKLEKAIRVYSKKEFEKSGRISL